MQRAADAPRAGRSAGSGARARGPRASREGHLTRGEWRALSARHWPGIYQKAAVQCWKFMVIAERVHALLDPVVLRYGIQPGDFEVLVTLRIRGAPYQLSPTAIYRARCLSSGGLTKILHRLTLAQLVVRRPDPEDRRSQFVRLTAKGKRVVEAAMEAMGRLEKELLKEFDRAERERLSGLTDKLMATLDPESFKIGSNN